MATHFVGIPLIMVAIAALTAAVAVGPISGAVILAVAALLFYVHVSPGSALVMTPVVAIVLVAGDAIAALPTSVWLAWSIGLFVVGWIFQAIGHVFEGRKPAFFDDLRGLLDGPLFLMAEIGFALGLAPELKREIRAIAATI